MREENSQIAKFIALIAIGGNLPSTFGSVCETIVSSLDALGRAEREITAVSKFYETPCYPIGQGPDFINCVAELKTELQPEALLSVLHDIEQQFERTRETRWGGRTLDMDLLSFENRVLPNEATYAHWLNLPLQTQLTDAPADLILPHPRLQDRGFVLIPLCDIRPNWRHPVLGQTAREMCDALPQEQVVGVKPL
jgi:2-amino-4-hydroxy-6-hydroxymethyldihydropteridine diphosphokinase